MLWASLQLAASAALADPVTLEDFSTTVPPAVSMAWVPGSRTGQMEGRFLVHVRINTRPWMGRSGRIYMVMPLDASSGIELAWTADGPLFSGRLRPGERTLVYAGAISSEVLRDQLRVHLQANPDGQSNSRRVDFRFEFDAN